MASNVSSIRPIPQVHQAVIESSLIDELIDKVQAFPKEERFKWATKLYRETIEFGIVYRQLEEEKIVENPMPAWITKIRQTIFEKFRDQIQEGSQSEEFNNCIVSFYKAGDGMVPHIDRAIIGAKDGRERSYYFGDSILGLILVPDTQQGLYFLNPTGNERISLKEEKGMAFLFQGELRQKWKHGLDTVEKNRISMTFRTVKFK